MKHTPSGSAGPPTRSDERSTFRRRVAKLLTILVLALVTISVAGGCSADSTDTSSGTTISSTTGTPATTAPSSTTSSATDTSSTATTGGRGPGTGVETEAKRLSPDTGRFATCPDCHAFLDPPSPPRPALTDAFRHEKHLARSAPCTACHAVPVHTETVVRRPTMAACFQCHGEEASSTAPSDCALCHPPGFRLIPESHGEAFYEGEHPAVVAAVGAEECFVCHQGGETGFCRACHGLDMPHPTGWALDPGGGPGAHVTTAHQDAAVCVRCHENRGPAPAGCYGGECHGS